MLEAFSKFEVIIIQFFTVLGNQFVCIVVSNRIDVSFFGR